MTLVPDQVVLAARVHRQYLGPDENQQRAQLPGAGLQQLQHVREDSHTEGQVDRPGPEVKESAQQVQGS